MKLKVTVLDEDSAYLGKFASALSGRFSTQLEAFCFSEKESAIAAVQKNRSQIFLVSDSFEMDDDEVPNGCLLARFVASKEIKNIKGCRAICKYQKIEGILQELQDLYVDNLPTGMKISSGSGNLATRKFAFLSASGGVGVTSMAVAFAKTLALQGQKVFFLTLDPYANTDIYFDGEGTGSMDDALFFMRRNDPHVSLKIKKFFKKDSSGVYYFSPTKNALDLTDFDSQDFGNLLNVLHDADAFSAIVMDVKFEISELMETIFDVSESIIYLSDGTETANDKVARAYAALDVFQQQNDFDMTSKLSVLYNKFSKKNGKILTDDRIHNLGGVRRIENADFNQVVFFLMKEAPFARLI